VIVNDKVVDSPADASPLSSAIPTEDGGLLYIDQDRRLIHQGLTSTTIFNLTDVLIDGVITQSPIQGRYAVFTG